MSKERVQHTATSLFVIARQMRNRRSVALMENATCAAAFQNRTQELRRNAVKSSYADLVTAGVADTANISLIASFRSVLTEHRRSAEGLIGGQIRGTGVRKFGSVGSQTLSTVQEQELVGRFLVAVCDTATAMKSLGQILIPPAPC
jgi:hypothetical protein